ncbi:uncharacterized protein Z518_08218 [Rhinocladiella mackenziei CBS 650.93]|uniref:Uncharacterized protein n=1 Tax=Rhinocladiella mackenziei CBS 650.93 TaxID=1442369 RepID=A0A0D2I8W1_9EURO|nr:uncharacterized protein Z518_08218 [Rhinocladiella mackenziei CBS 650.93]KIX02279.1 hypothetical protein Z518_08218 [Rhinocladiella mackenziei CBS 650.93]
MDESQSERSPSYGPSTSHETYRPRSASHTPTEQRLSLEVGPHSPRRGPSPLALEPETLSYGLPGEESLEDVDDDDDDDEDDDNQPRAIWDPRRSTSDSPKSLGEHSPRDRAKGKGKGKGKEREMSSSSNPQSRMGGTGTPSDRRPDISRTSSASTASTSRQGSVEARSKRRDERTGSGSGSSSGRSRLVSGVFVRY